MISRTLKEFTKEDIEQIGKTYHAWRGEAEAGGYEAYDDEAGYCKAASLDDIKANDYVLTPGRYVGAAPLEDDGIPFRSRRGFSGNQDHPQSPDDDPCFARF